MEELLTSTEERIMQIIWRLEKAFVKDIIDELPAPKPPYNTVSSVVRLLEQKGYLGHKAYGRAHEYHPLIPKKDYSKLTFRKLLSSYFEGSYQSLVSYIVNEEKLSVKEIKELESLISLQRKENQSKNP
ncbi:MAG: BlaI/MecI/CopY family transcriptional regulator [Flavobacteriales bacterium]|nr:BlaI/MecI/CopY family transcriptional regulator [Flavobacteriales bacterium]